MKLLECPKIFFDLILVRSSHCDVSLSHCSMLKKKITFFIFQRQRNGYEGSLKKILLKILRMVAILVKIVN